MLIKTARLEFERVDIFPGISQLQILFYIIKSSRYLALFLDILSILMSIMATGWPFCM